MQLVLRLLLHLWWRPGHKLGLRLLEMCEHSQKPRNFPCNLLQRLLLLLQQQLLLLLKRLQHDVI